LEGNAQIHNTNKEKTNLTFEVENVSENTKLELPYIFYLGYDATLVSDNGETTQLQIQESEKGFCMITLPNMNKGVITISYKGTKLMCCSYVLSIAGFCRNYIFGVEKDNIMWYDFEDAILKIQLRRGPWYKKLFSNQYRTVG